MRAFVARRSRIVAGSMQLFELMGRESAPGERADRELLPTVLRRPGLWVPFVVYKVTSKVAHRRALATLHRDGRIGWNRDTTTRAMTHA